jgi:hypothetical protein
VFCTIGVACALHFDELITSFPAIKLEFLIVEGTSFRPAWYSCVIIKITRLE